MNKTLASISGSLLVLLAALQSIYAQNTERASGPLTSDAQAAAGLNLDIPELKPVQDALQANDWIAAKAAYLDYRRKASPAKWRINPADMPAQPVAESDEAGDEICQHIIRDRVYRFCKLPCDMGKDWNWLANPVARNSPEYTMEWTWCVISRMEFWQDLADAYWKTHNEKYAREWVAQLLDFARKCPANATTLSTEPSLWRTLDSAGRVGGSWPYAYYHFLNSSAMTPEAQWIYLRLMYDHANVLIDGLRNTQRTGNWVMAECSALYTIGALFPDIKDAESWRNIALNRIADELKRTVPPDGYEVELTPMYHYFSLSSYATLVQLANMNKLPVPQEFREKMLAMYRAPILVSDQLGYYVPTNDSGKYKVAGSARRGIELLGPDPLLLWAATEGKEGVPPPLSTMLPYAGFYAMRSGWNRDDLFLFFRGGPAGIGHQHEDMLQIVLNAGGKTLLFDPGTYSYDHSDWRRYVINTASHNTAIVDGKWQHRGANKPPVIEPVKNPWITTPLFDFVAATYDGGYQKNEYDPTRQYTPEKWTGEIDRSVTHTRRVVYLKPGYVLVVDSLDGTGQHTFDVHFHLDATDAKVDPQSQAVTSQNPDGIQLALIPLDRHHLTSDVVKGQTDPLLGWFPGGNESQHRPIPTIRFRKQQAAPATFATLLCPYRDAMPEIQSKDLRLNSSSLWGQQITTASETMQIVLSKDQKPEEMELAQAWGGILTARAAGLILRESTDRTLTALGLWGADNCNAPELQFS